MSSHRVTKFTKFFSCNPQQDALFAVNGAIALDDALEQAATFLSAAERVVLNLAAEGDGDECAFAALYLVQISRALVNASIKAEAEKGGAQ